MSFRLPPFLEQYINKKGDSPFPNFVNTSQFYAQTNVYVMTYLNRVVRQCMAYGCGVHDGAYNGGLSANIGYTVIKNATKLIKGDKTLFNGADEATRFLSDTWAPYSRFDIFLEEAITYTLQGGTCLIKLNRDKYGRCSLTANRIDRCMFTTNDMGDITDAIFLNTLLSSTERANESTQLWLVEHRYYDKSQPKVVYKVHCKSGTSESETLPLITSDGMPFESLGEDAKLTIARKGIKLNRPVRLPFRDGLGVWALLNTATNSCVPNLRMGDPALYGTLDLLWSIDAVFSGTIIDVLNGEGKILVPKKYLTTLNTALQSIKTDRAPTLRVFEPDASAQGENFVYVATPDDKDFPPTSVQFDIRSEPYRGMWEMYLKQFAVSFGYAPTTLFPYLQDDSPKTAREVTAEENLTRASVQSAHRLFIPELNRAIAEVLYQAGFVGKATIQLSDYIGNKLMRDENMRQNYAAGLVPHETAVQVVNGLSAKETQEYMDKLATEQKESAFGGKEYDDSEYFGG